MGRAQLPWMCFFQLEVTRHSRFPKRSHPWLRFQFWGPPLNPPTAKDLKKASNCWLQDFPKRLVKSTQILFPRVPKKSEWSHGPTSHLVSGASPIIEQSMLRTSPMKQKKGLLNFTKTCNGQTSSATLSPGAWGQRVQQDTNICSASAKSAFGLHSLFEDPSFPFKSWTHLPWRICVLISGTQQEVPGVKMGYTTTPSASCNRMTSLYGLHSSTSWRSPSIGLGRSSVGVRAWHRTVVWARTLKSDPFCDSSISVP